MQLKKTDTLSEYTVLGEFCQQAARDLATQRGREYGFGSSVAPPRATELHKLKPEDLESLSTNNLDCERDLKQNAAHAQKAHEYVHTLLQKCMTWGSLHMSMSLKHAYQQKVHRS